jgi:signal transduction histidine kinase
MKNIFKIIFKSLTAKIVLFITLLVIGIITLQTVVYTQTEAKNMKDVLIQNKKDFVELLAINFGTAQSVGGFAFQSQLIEDSVKTQDTLFVKFVNPNGEVYLSSIAQEKGQYVRDEAVSTKKTIVKDAEYDGKNIKIVVSPSPGGYTTWLGFSLDSVDATINSTIISRAILAGIILLIGILCSFWLAFYMTRNIRILRDAAEDVTKGNLKAKADVKSSDEIGSLATTFNHMTERLLALRNNLEKKIKELSEEHGRMSSLVESVKLGIIMVDLNLNVILSNSAANKMLGRLDSEKLSFHDLSERMKGNVDISQALSYYVHTGTPVNIQEVMIGEKYVRLFMSPVRDISDKMFIGAVVVMEDITDQKKLDKMRTEIVSITSHQLRTPSTIIKGNLEMLIGHDLGELNKQQEEVLNDAYQGNQRMIHLINDLMDVAKIDEGKFKLALDNAQLENLVGGVVDILMPLAKERNVALEFHRPSAALPPVKINIDRVTQVVQNIIDNALKYSGGRSDGKVEIEIREGGKSLEVVVKDNGIGIPVAEQSKIFERFSRGSNSIKLDPGGGSGLGLYIAKAVVEQGGGQVWFESKENEGTTFHATFPYSLL